jgi:hypothetical protein
LVYQTIFKTIKEQVPDQALVLPGHYATPREARPDGSYAMPLRDLWRRNQSLHYTDEAAFADFVLGNLPKMPQEYIEIKRVNIGLAHPESRVLSKRAKYPAPFRL